MISRLRPGQGQQPAALWLSTNPAKYPRITPNKCICCPCNPLVMYKYHVMLGDRGPDRSAPSQARPKGWTRAGTVLKARPTIPIWRPTNSYVTRAFRWLYGNITIGWYGNGGGRCGWVSGSFFREKPGRRMSGPRAPSPIPWNAKPGRTLQRNTGGSRPALARTRRPSGRSGESTEQRNQ